MLLIYKEFLTRYAPHQHIYPTKHNILWCVSVYVIRLTPHIWAEVTHHSHPLTHRIHTLTSLVQRPASMIHTLSLSIKLN